MTPQLSDCYLLHAAYWAAEAARRVYPKHRDAPSRGEWVMDHCFGQCSTNGRLLCTQRDCLIAVAGTDDLRDWLHNADLSPAIIGSLQVSRGTWQYSCYAAQGLIELLKQLPVNPLVGRRLFLAGHSLGGAAALLLPMALSATACVMLPRRGRYGTLRELLVAGIEPERIFTFDTPRVLTSRSGSWYPFDAVQLRTMHGLVSELPPRLGGLIDRDHFGRILWLRGDQLHASPPTGLRWLKLLLSGWPFSWQAVRRDHSITEIVRRLEPYLISPSWREAVDCDASQTIVPPLPEKDDGL